MLKLNSQTGRLSELRDLTVIETRSVLRGACACCGRRQRVTQVEQDLPCAPRCKKCGGAIQVGVKVASPKTKTSQHWRCPGCGGIFTLTDLWWSVALHLRDSQKCADVLLDKDRFLRTENSWFLPETAYLEKGDVAFRLMATHPEGKLVCLGEWRLKDKKIAVARLREVNSMFILLHEKGIVKQEE